MNGLKQENLVRQHRLRSTYDVTERISTRYVCKTT